MLTVLFIISLTLVSVCGSHPLLRSYPLQMSDFIQTNYFTRISLNIHYIEERFK